MDGVNITPLKIIQNINGDIFHAMKSSDKNFFGFGEAYFSSLNQGAIKGWKKHNKMILNLIVVVGEIKFVIYNESNYYEVVLSKNNYQRLTILPGLWVAFQGLLKENILLNLANIEHDPNESDNKNLIDFDYNWNKFK
jgi:dTDP-4-dehydrorhamnose 3,5-epimerase